MFKCGKCMRTSVPGEKATRVTVETREVTYADGRSGLEIAKEMTICRQCSMKYALGKQEIGEPITEFTEAAGMVHALHPVPVLSPAQFLQLIVGEHLETHMAKTYPNVI